MEETKPYHTISEEASAAIIEKFNKVSKDVGKTVVPNDVGAEGNVQAALTNNIFKKKASALFRRGVRQSERLNNSVPPVRHADLILEISEAKRNKPKERKSDKYKRRQNGS